MGSKSAEVPVIDIGGFETGDEATRRAIAGDFDRALIESGFLAIAGHGIPAEVIGDLDRDARAFFDLPFDGKARFAPLRRAMNRGYIAMGAESVSATLSGETPPDLCEALVFRSLYAENAQAREATRKWSNFWPTDPPSLTESVTRYYWAIDGLIPKLYRIAAMALDLPEDYFEPFHTEHQNTLRIVNYPDQPDAPLDNQLRYGAHHDYGGFTILQQDDAPGGLQIADTDGRWHDVPVVEGTFVINVGDLISRWTNKRWRSTLHRVTNPPRNLTGSTRRLSIVVFSRPDDLAEIACLPTCKRADELERFAPVSAGDFVRAKLEASATDKTA